MKSMTGYGAVQLSSKKLNLNITVRSVNGRYLEQRFHIPKEYAAF